MTSFRSDARRVLDARRERASTTPVPVAAPVASTVAVAAVTAVVLVLAGAGFLLVALTLAVVALLAAGAAHRTTASLFAGVTLWLIRPYRPGERVRLYLREQGRTVDAEIVRIGLLNTTLAGESAEAAEAGLFVVANTSLLRLAPECRR